MESRWTLPRQKVMPMRPPPDILTYVGVRGLLSMRTATPASDCSMVYWSTVSRVAPLTPATSLPPASVCFVSARPFRNDLAYGLSPCPDPSRNARCSRLSSATVFLEPELLDGVIMGQKMGGGRRCGPLKRLVDRVRLACRHRHEDGYRFTLVILLQMSHDLLVGHDVGSCREHV